MSGKSAQAIFEIARVEAQYAYNAAMREAYSVLQSVKGVNDDIYLATMMTARAQFEAAVSNTENDKHE